VKFFKLYENYEENKLKTNETIISNHKVFNYTGRNLIIYRVQYEESTKLFLRNNKSTYNLTKLGVTTPSN